ncbi:MAG: Uma2 family endonuclease [Deferrisomatales bacterium]
MAPPQETRRTYTYADYARWPEGERWELVDGEPWAMTPAPTLRHQRVVVRILHLLETALQGHRCTAYVAPADVLLSDEDVVQPDVFVVCDPAKITPEGLRGAPEVVFEVTSPSTAFRDRGVKRALYERAGVREYVIVDPDGRYAEAWALDASAAYGPSRLVGPRESLALQSLGGLALPIAELLELTPDDLKTPLPPPLRQPAPDAG